ncbi:succinate dehydrogenase assembly factor 2 [Sphingobium sp. H39-3-25]|jgi:antitoxin CptB|uniref:FAD assembly factor SdhE n=1 Tax=Sphingobium arseniciresistens TaxID=3030834 RepID=UPI0023B92435|nr:succinate dehydrogenase assembly factor 2 [Sphingobium arseniciresistens]
MTDDIRLRRLRFRAWHRGTKEADIMIGCFFDRHGTSWNDEEIAWYETFLEEQDVDIMAWALGTQPVPEHFKGPMMEAFCRLDYIKIAE